MLFRKSGFPTLSFLVEFVKQIFRERICARKRRIDLANNIREKALELSEDLAKECGVYVVDAEYAKNEDGDYSLCFYIDKEGGVGIDDCEGFSKAVEEILDRENIIDTNYMLEVASPGADRILKTERELNYYAGREVDVKLYAAMNGAKEFTGVLKGVKDGAAVIEYNGEVVEIAPKQAVYIRLSFKF